MLLLLAFACSRSPELVEGDAVQGGIRRLREAPAEDDRQRKALVDQLAAMPARMAEAKEARDACAGAYSSLLAVRARKAKAAAEIDGGAPIDGLGDLLEAQTELARAGEAMARCDAASTALVRALRR